MRRPVTNLQQQLAPDHLLRQKLERVLLPRGLAARFQPIVDLEHGQIAGFEALCKPAADGVFKNPLEMFDAAERVDRTWDLEIACLGTILSVIEAWPAGTQLFVNSSPETIANSSFSETLARLSSRSEDLTSGRIVLELTERSEHPSQDGLSANLSQLRECGYQIAIDDVGAGMSGLNRMMSVRPHWLKLDRDLVALIHQDKVRQNLIRFFVDFARLSGVKVIAEGIETIAELETLIELGIVYGQGFLLGRPSEARQDLDAAIAKRIVGMNGSSQRQLPLTRNEYPIVHFARPAMAAETDTPVAEIASRLLRQKETTGVVIMNGNRFLGWCSRQAVFEAAMSERASASIGLLSRCGSMTLAPDASVNDALSMAACRGEEGLSEPIVLIGAGCVVGMVGAQDLLRAASTMRQGRELRVSPLTGLPDRVQAERQIERLNREAKGDDKTAQIARDLSVAIIDVHDLASYNRQYGYDLGDRLIRDLGALVHSLGAECRDSFVAHLDCDQFMFVARSTVLVQTLGHLANEFDRSIAGASRTRLPILENCPAPEHGPHLRVVLLEDVFGQLEHASELFKLMQAAKQDDLAPTPHEAGLTALHARRLELHGWHKTA